MRTTKVMAVAVAAAALAAGSASAATMPAKALAKRADAICTMENGKRGKLPGRPKFQDPAKATNAQLKAATPYLRGDLAITRDEISKVFALGTPSEPAAATAWTKLRATLQAHMIPVYTKAVEAAEAGNKAAVLAAFKTLDSYDGVENAYAKTIGFKVCGH
jgi:hypothetical protein